MDGKAIRDNADSEISKLISNYASLRQKVFNNSKVVDKSTKATIPDLEIDEFMQNKRINKKTAESTLTKMLNKESDTKDLKPVKRNQSVTRGM